MPLLAEGGALEEPLDGADDDDVAVASAPTLAGPAKPLRCTPRGEDDMLRTHRVQEKKSIGRCLPGPRGSGDMDGREGCLPLSHTSKRAKTPAPVKRFWHRDYKRFWQLIHELDTKYTYSKWSKPEGRWRWVALTGYEHPATSRDLTGGRTQPPVLSLPLLLCVSLIVHAFLCRTLFGITPLTKIAL